MTASLVAASFIRLYLCVSAPCLGIRASTRLTARQAPLAVAMPKPAAAICWKVAPLIIDSNLTNA